MSLSQMQGNKDEKRMRRMRDTLRELRAQMTKQLAKSASSASGLARRQAGAAHDSRGMASILVTGILIALICVMVVGLSAYTNRELNKSLANQQGQAAYDAAQSGINDAASYILAHPGTSATGCGDLLGSGKISPTLSSDSSTKYTCILADTTPTELDYQTISTDTSQSVKFSTSAVLSKMMVSWQADNRTNNHFVPTAQAGTLYDETTWSNDKYAPLLRVTIYPVPADTHDISYATANAKTFFLYPQQAPSSTSDITKINFSSAPSGSIQNVDCGTTNTGNFTGTADDDCNAILTHLPTTDSSGYDYYMTLTPTYGTTDVKLKANGSTNQSLTFLHSQALIDVTAQSGSALKRLQARVDISNSTSGGQSLSAGSDQFPVYALRTSDSICKRLQLPASGQAYIDNTSLSECSELNLPQGQLPTVTTGGAQHYGQSGTSDSSNYYLNGSLTTNGSSVTSCYVHWDNDNDGYVAGKEWTAASGKHDCTSPGLPISDTSGSVNVQARTDIGNTNESNHATIYYQLCAVNSVGTNCGNLENFTAGPPVVNMTSAVFTSGSQKLVLGGTVIDHNQSGVKGWFISIECPNTGAFPIPPQTKQSIPANTSTDSISYTIQPWTFFYCGSHSSMSFEICASNDGFNNVCSSKYTINQSGGGSSSGSSGSGSSSSGGGGSVPVCHAYSIVKNDNSHASVNGDCSNADYTLYSARFDYSDITGVSCGSETKDWSSNSTFTYAIFHKVSAVGRVQGHNSAGFSDIATTSNSWYTNNNATCVGEGGSTSSTGSGSSSFGGSTTSSSGSGSTGSTSTTSSTSSGSSTTSSGGGSGCFTAGTLILTPNGEVPIEQLKVGDWVESWSTQEGKMVAAQIGFAYHLASKPTLWIVTSGGSVTTTSIHPFWTGKAWVEAKDLRPGSTVMDKSGKLLTVLFTMNGQNRTVYNFEVSNPNHDFFANDFLVHNRNTL